ncbi:MAG TPA: hypothetical protein VD704_07660 [Gaiellaceae bacterium]|nr:hypothetical protein [Gaiellaceae bacterium]
MPERPKPTPIEVFEANIAVNAVNADGTYGEWRYEIVHDMNLVPALLDAV